MRSQEPSKSFVSQSTKNGRRIIERNMKINESRKLKALEEAENRKEYCSNNRKVKNIKVNNKIKRKIL